MRENLNILWAELIIEEFIRNRIDHFCICPGSRSSPIVVAVARNKKAKPVICYDERGASFYALNYARAKRRPAVVITTSGTAVANCFPAVIEAYMDCVPVIIFSADRPPELQDSRENQTIYQEDIFGRYVKYFFNIPPADENIPPQMLLTTVDQAIYRSISHPNGPVHINWMIREPLAPEKVPFNPSYTCSLSDWLVSERPYTEYPVPEKDISEDQIRKIAGLINEAENGLLIIGETGCKGHILELLKKIPWPVFSDIRSGIYPYMSENVLPYFSLLLRSFIPKKNPDLVIHIGKPVVSKHIYQLIRLARRYVVIKEGPFRQDPVHRSMMQIDCSIKIFCEKIIPYISAKRSKGLEELRRICEKISVFLEDLMKGREEINEAILAYDISKNIPEKTALFLSNSMPVRDMDMYGRIEKEVEIYANRGASGIDGIVSSSIGIAQGSKKLTTAIIGDLAFLHDMNSLSILKRTDSAVIFVLINNGGGGIFSFLPISKFNKVFEYFFTPHHICSFEPIASLFEIPYFPVKKREDLLKAYRECVRKRKSAIIEVFVDREENFRFHKKVEDEIKKIQESVL